MIDSGDTVLARKKEGSFLCFCGTLRRQLGPAVLQADEVGLEPIIAGGSDQESVDEGEDCGRDSRVAEVGA